MYQSLPVLSMHMTDTTAESNQVVVLRFNCPMPGMAVDKLKCLSHSDTQQFANYLGSHLRTLGKLSYTGHFASPEEKRRLYNNWGQEMVSRNCFLVIYSLH